MSCVTSFLRQLQRMRRFPDGNCAAKPGPYLQHRGGNHHGGLSPLPLSGYSGETACVICVSDFRRPVERSFPFATFRGTRETFADAPDHGQRPADIAIAFSQSQTSTSRLHGSCPSRYRHRSHIHLFFAPLPGSSAGRCLHVRHQRISSVPDDQKRELEDIRTDDDIVQRRRICR